MQAQRRHSRNQKAGKSGILAGVGILARSRLFIKLTACLMLTGMVAEGLYELLMQYFQLKLGFTQGDQVRLGLGLDFRQYQSVFLFAQCLATWRFSSS